MKKIFFVAVLLTIFTYASGQVIRASLPKVAIKDGDGPLTRYWDHLIPGKRPVIYQLDKNKPRRKVSFYTDKDSISFWVSPGKEYEFSVLLGGKDICHAVLNTIIPSYYKDCVPCTITRDSIPFTLGKDDAIHIKGQLNGVDLNLIFDTGASLFVLSETGYAKSKASLDGWTENEGSGGFSTERTSSCNHLQLGTMQWKGLPLVYINYHRSLEADGIVGFNVFEDKIVGIDYDRGLLIISGNGIVNKKSYFPLATRHSNEGTFVEASLTTASHTGKGWFLFDTGGALTLAISGDFAEKNNFYNELKSKGNINVVGTGPGKNKSKMAMLPGMNLAALSLKNIPVLLGEPNVTYYGRAGIIGMPVLKRFNTLIDYPHGLVYIKPNKLFGLSFDRTDGNKILFIAIGIIALIAAFVLYKKVKNVSLFEKQITLFFMILLYSVSLALVKMSHGLMLFTLF